MKKVKNILWGMALIVLGVIFALNALEITDIHIFFDGWWTLFIIVPCAIGLFTDYEKAGNLIGIIIGVLILLVSQDILSFKMLAGLLIPIIIVLIGFRLIFGALRKNNGAEIINSMKKDGKALNIGNAVFSECRLNYDGKMFEGAEINAVFGGGVCDLRNAIIQKDCVIKAAAVFGGVDILVPDNINVQVNSNSVFGGVDNKKKNMHVDNARTLYINVTCIFGGADIK